ncbi:MAG: potassium-transporting ATPase subunit KdpB, partial [Chlamydiota bacterium]
FLKMGEYIPADGEIIKGEASIDESSVTGESQPVIKGAQGDHTSVISGSLVVSDEITVRITADMGKGFLDKMITLIEGARRKKTSNELALSIFLSGIAIVFLMVVCSLKIFSLYFHIHIPLVTLAALLVCLIPTTIGGLLSAIGIAGINRLMQKNVLAMSGQAIEAAGDIDVILIDKTGTITIGNRQAFAMVQNKFVLEIDCARVCYLASLEDNTPEGKSIREYMKNHYPDIEQEEAVWDVRKKPIIIPFSAKTRMSGVDLGGIEYRKGAQDAIEHFVGTPVPLDLSAEIKKISRKGGTPILVATKDKIYGVVFLKDIVKPGLVEKFAKLRSMGQKIVMITGDHRLTAAAIAKEAGVDDFLAEATPEHKLEYLKEIQSHNYTVAMTGDGVNDAPALAHADVGVAMSSGTQAAKEAGNMIDLDSNPTKLFAITQIGKQLLMTRGSLTTFSIANDLAKYFAILPAIMIPYFPEMEIFNVMRLATPQSSILSAVIFNALVIVALIPLAFQGVTFVPQEPAKLLRKNLLNYGLGGVLVPFLGIKFIDIILHRMGWF